MKVRFTETAFDELKELYASIAGDNAVAARVVVTRIEHIIDRIGDFPDIAMPIDTSGIRVFPTPPFPYLVFYTGRQREIIIRNIRYAGRRRSYNQ